MEEIKVSEMLQADSINKDDSVMIIQEGVNKKASGSIQTATGTSLSLTSVADTCKIKSNSKNLFNNQISTQTKGGVTITKGKDGTLTLNGTTTNNVLITIDIVKLENGKTYTLSGGSEIETQGARIDMRVSADGALYNTWYIPDNPTRTMTEDVTLYAVLRLQNGVTFDNVVIKPQLEEGSSATSYNPYNTEVKICGKNLFDKNIAPTQNWIFDTANTKIIASANGKSTYIPCKANTTYTISKISAFRFQVATTSTTPAIDVAYSDYIENNDGTTITLTTGASAQYIVIYYWHPNSGIAEQIVLDTLQVEEGSTATTYEKFEGQYLDLIPDETKSAFTYDSLTNIISNGSVTIKYNTKGRVLNNDDTLAIKEYVDREMSIDEYNINLSYTTIASTYQFFKSNGIATITAGNIWIGASLSANSWLDIGTIPSACIPKTPITFSTAISDGYNGRVISYGKGSVTTDGKIRVMVSSALTSQNTLGLNFSVTYLT